MKFFNKSYFILNFILTIILIITKIKDTRAATITTKTNIVAENIVVNDLYLQRIKSNLNATTNPCEDFYEYTCGNWHKNYNGTEYIDMPGYMDYTVNQQFAQIIKNIMNNTQVYGRLLDVYDSCVNLETLALNRFLTMVQEELYMKWPLFSLNETQWQNQTDFDWLATIAMLRKYGFNGVFVTQNINVLPSNGSHYVVEITQHAGGSSFEFDELEEIFINFGFYHNESHLLTSEVMKLEKAVTKLAQVKYVNETEERKYSDNFKLYTLEQFQELIPQVDWHKYFAITLNRSDNLSDLPVQSFALDTEFFKNLNELFESTSNETIAYYIMLKFMLYINTNLPQQRPKDCIKYLRSYMPVYMNFLYEGFLFKTKRSKMELALEKIFENLKLEFKAMVQENHLKLDAEEQQFIIKELQTMQLKIGNLPVNCTEQFVSKYYETLITNDTDFFFNHLELLKFFVFQEYQKLENVYIPFSQKIFDLDPSTFSSSSPVKIFDNAILIPYGYLQMPLFDAQLHEIYQYSHFGFILAHEIIHAYDLFHIIYDHQGNYNWLGSRVASHYFPYIQCYAHSPSDILSENIADISGLRLAYRTYRNMLQDLTDFNLDFMNLSKEQFFFVNSVQFLCANVNKISNLDLVTLDLSHDMHDTRVRRNWGNYEEFGRVFECAQNSSMYPAETCRLW
ncbi:phosphate-regulating neutral endopeptidase PHEX-like [Lucilia sericata]|uniref:phosphate-regulating neutral endopeptidase PHEX-like n=1 Tax=Lucilia sericata TaxID=13632 RepID=UPI0018A87ACE|nr:phosphate-regulating neutral endopeptidase PHEX-like [Lucilia sericata]